MTRERHAAELECECGHLVCHRPPCAGRLYHDQVMHDFLAHGDGDALGDLVAGRIDQAEYRRRMADLERRAADSLDVDPAPASRRPEPDRSGAVIVWLAVALAGVLLWIAIAGIVVYLSAAPRTTHQPTVELGPSEGTTAGAGDTSLTVNLGASAVGSSGASHVRGALDPGNGSQAGSSSEGSLATLPRSGGAPLALLSSEEGGS